MRSTTEERVVVLPHLDLLTSARGVNEDGVVVYKHLGPLTRQIWQDEFVPLIDAERGTTR